MHVDVSGHMLYSVITQTNDMFTKRRVEKMFTCQGSFTEAAHQGDIQTVKLSLQKEKIT